MSTTPAKKAAPKKPAAKAPAAKSIGPAPKAAAAPKPAAKPSPASTTVDTEPAPKGHATHAASAKSGAHGGHAPRPPATRGAHAEPSRGRHSVGAPATPPVAALATSADAQASSSRFADRFAPPRPPTRQMNNLAVDMPKQPIKADPKLANAWKAKAGKDLTEEELLAMPESEYMNEKQLEFFRTRLQALKDGLLSNAGETTEHLREDTSIVPDPADRATIEEEHALELRTRDRERKLLKKISQSLARIDSGEYGFCDETGEPIGLGRLIARPTATLSLEAQQRRELKQKMFGD